MYGRKNRGKRGFRRAVVTLLTFVMLVSTCFPSLVANAAEESEIAVAAAESQEITAGAATQESQPLTAEGEPESNGAGSQTPEDGTTSQGTEGQTGSEESQSQTTEETPESNGTESQNTEDGTKSEGTEEQTESEESQTTEDETESNGTGSGAQPSEDGTESKETEETADNNGSTDDEVTGKNDDTNAVPAVSEAAQNYLHQIAALQEEANNLNAEDADIQTKCADIYARLMSINTNVVEAKNNGSITEDEYTTAYNAIGGVVMALNGYGYNPYAVATNAETAQISYNNKYYLSIEFVDESGASLSSSNNKNYSIEANQWVSIADIAEKYPVNGYKYSHASSESTAISQINLSTWGRWYYNNTNWLTNKSIITMVYSKAVAAPYMITFRPNGGSGNAFTVTTDESGAFSFPGNTFTREGYTFAGWKLSSEANDSGATVYGSAVEHTVTSDTEYVAVWIDNEGSENSTPVMFFIRLDGQKPQEPSSHPTNQYTDKITINGALRSLVAVNNDDAAVKANLAKKPTDEQIGAAIRAAGYTYDPSTQYVVWYVIKYDESDGWHVDGVLAEKTKYWVHYFPNGGSTYGIPAAKQYSEGVTVEIEYGVPTRQGYVFLGWDEDHSATVPKYPVNGEPNSFAMPDADVDLYAIWEPSNATEYKIEYYLEQEDRQTYSLQAAETVTRKGKTGSTATVQSADIKSFDGWIYAPSNENNVSSGQIAADGTLVLKLYYELPDVADLAINKTFSGLEGTVEMPASITVTVANDATEKIVTLTPNEDKSQYSGRAEDLTIGERYTVIEDLTTADIANWTLTGTTYNENTTGSIMITGKDDRMAIVNTYERSTTKITLDKDVAGNMADRNREFVFCVKVNGEQLTETYKLTHNTNPVEIVVPVGAEVEIIEQAVTGYTASAKVNNNDVNLDGTTLTIENVQSIEYNVLYINTNNAAIDTGISMPTFPFILLFSTVAVLGSVYLIGKRRYGEF